MTDSLATLRRILHSPECVVMGILNVTPDSFSDGGRFLDRETCRLQIRNMIESGARIIDVGGESTRPGASPVSVDEELARVLPVIEMIRAESDIPVSIDTSKPDVMRAAVAAGATMINDVCALQGAGALETVAELSVPVCLMHMQGQPRTMQQQPYYDDVVNDVHRFLQARITACIQAGIRAKDIVIDPGFGFGKTLQHNLMLFRHLEVFRTAAPLLVGVSRKSMIGTILDKSVDERLHGSIGLATLACWLGARIIRVHDVAETVDALKVCQAVMKANDS